MKQPSECKCTMVGAKITKLTSGNTAGRVDRWSLTSGLAGNGKVPDGSWATSRVCCKATATEVTIISVERASCTLRAGRMPGESFSMQSNSIPKIKHRFESWCRRMSSLPLRPKDRKSTRLNSSHVKISYAVFCLKKKKKKK